MNKVVAGVDLHSNNLVIGVMDTDGKRLANQKVACRLSEVVKFLAPFKKRLEQVAVESTSNWYWLVDGLRALRYPVVRANPAGMEQYSGIKHADDTNDAFFLAELTRLKILPTGHIYDAELRPVRDLLRRRLSLVHQRTALMLSFKSLYTRTTGQAMSLGELKDLEVKEAQQLYDHPANQLIAGMQIKHIEQLTGRDQGLCRARPLCQLLPHGGGPADVQPQEERREQLQMRQQVFGLGVCGRGQFCAALQRAVSQVVRSQSGQDQQ